MKYHRRIRWSNLFTTSSGLTRLALIVLMSPVVLLAAALATVVMALEGALSLLGVTPRQPRAPWRTASEMLGTVLARAAGRQGFTA